MGSSMAEVCNSKSDAAIAADGTAGVASALPVLKEAAARWAADEEDRIRALAGRAAVDAADMVACDCCGLRVAVAGRWARGPGRSSAPITKGTARAAAGGNA